MPLYGPAQGIRMAATKAAFARPGPPSPHRVAPGRVTYRVIEFIDRTKKK
jgi:hypothetical protein